MRGPGCQSCEIETDAVFLCGGERQDAGEGRVEGRVPMLSYDIDLLRAPPSSAIFRRSFRDAERIFVRRVATTA